VPIVASLDEVLYFFLPFYLTQLTVFGWLNGRSRSALLSDIYSLVLLFPLVLTIFQSLLWPFAKQFQVTPKGTSSDQCIFNWHLAWPLLLLLMFNAYSLFHTLDLGWIWSAYNLVMIGIALRILVDVPHPDRHITFALHRIAKLTLDNGHIHWGTTTIISEVGCHITLDNGTGPTTAATIALELPEADLILPAIIIPQSDPTQIHCPPTSPDVDLRQTLQSIAHTENITAGIILSGIGNLNTLALRFAGQNTHTTLDGKHEILTLAGTIGLDGVHLHMSVANAQGQVMGGHVVDGCMVYTTVELRISILPNLKFQHQLDDRTGFAELSIAPFCNES
jgi:predicted DNA-binding protein with PD1-like motif